MEAVTGYIYFIQSNEGVKIGYTKQKPIKRLKQLQTGCASRLNLVHYFPANNCRELERRIHFMFRLYKARPNSEWFQFPKEVIIWIQNWNCEADIQ